MKKWNKHARLLMALVMSSSAVPAFTSAPVLAQGETGQIQSTNVIDVTDFGADPTGIQDSQPAVVKAIEAAKNVQGSVTINFPEGTYNFYPEKAFTKEMYLSNTSGIQDACKTRTIGLCIEDMEDVVVNGNGSRFIFHNKMTPYASINSTNVAFQNFSIDFASPTCYELLALERSDADKSITYHIPESNNYSIQGTNIIWKSDVSPYTGQPYWTTTNKFDYTQYFDSKTGDAVRNAAGVLDNVSSIEDLGNNQIKIKYSSMPSVNPGYVWETRNTTRDQVAAALLYSKNVSLKDIYENYVHGFGMIVQMCDTITLDGVIFDTPERSGRATSSSADDINISGVKGLIEIKNSRFHNPHDDPINVHGTFLLVKSADRANRKVTVAYQHNETSGFPNYFEGDKIEFSTKGSLVPIAEDEEFTVVSADGPDGFGGQMGTGSANKNEIVLTLDKDIPEGVAANQSLVENISYTPDVYIHDNVFDASPTRGILCTTRGHVRIENNVFDRMNMAAIFISCDGQSWYESGRVKDISIKGNTFIRSNQADILIEPTNPTVSVDAPVHHKITIEDNLFFKDSDCSTSARENERPYVLNAKSTQGLVFRNNKVLRTDPFSSLSISADQLTMTTGQSTSITVNKSMNTFDHNLFRFGGCKDVLIDSNQYDPGLVPAIVTAGGTNAAHLEIQNDAAGIGASRIAEDAMPAWVSSDPEIVSISRDGTLKAVKEGQAVITSYIISGGRRFEAGKTTVTVSEAAADSSMTISGADELDPGQSIPLSVTGQPEGSVVTWSLVDAATGQATDKASIDANGVLSGAKGGVILVKASCGSASAFKAIAVHGESWTLSDSLTAVHTPSNVTGDEGLNGDSSSLTMIHGQRGLYQEQSAPYVLCADLPEGISPDNCQVTVKAVSTGSGYWGYSGLYLFKDQDNYISAERKNRGDASTSNEKMAAVREVSRSADETYENGSEGSATVLSGTTYWYRLTKKGTVVNASYSDDGVTFKPIKSDLDGTFLADSFKIAISAGENQSNNKYTTFSELTVSAADSTDTVISIPLTKKETISTPENPVLAMNGNSLQVAAAGVSSDSLICVWEKATSADGPWSLTDQISQDGVPGGSLNGQFVRAKVYRTKNEAVSQAVLTNALQMEETGSLEIAADKNSVRAGETLALHAQFVDHPTASVTWSVKDAITSEATDRASISQDGVLSAVHGGAVLVEAVSGSLKCSVPVVIHEDVYTVSDAGAIAHQGNAEAMSFGNGTFATRPVGQGIYQEQNASSVNMVQYTLPVTLDALETITVKANGYVPSGDRVYRETGLYLMKDDDNFVASTRKTRPAGIKNVAVREVNQNASEIFEGGGENTGPYITNQDIWLRLEKLASGQYKALYSTDGSTFIETGTMDALDLGDSPKIALSASGGNAQENLITFSDLQVNGKTVELTKMESVTPPAGVSVSLNEAQNALILSHDAMPEGTALHVLWGVSENADGPFSIDTTLTGASADLGADHQGKYMAAFVYGQKGSVVSDGVWTDSVQIGTVSDPVNPADTVLSSEARLKSASLDGNSLNLSETNWFFVRGIAQKTASVAFETLDPAAKMTVTVNKKAIAANADLNLLPGYNLVEVHVEAPDGVTVKDYRLQIFRNGDSDDSLASLKVNGQAVEMKEDGSASFIADAGVNMAAIEAIANSSSSTVKIYTEDGTPVTAAVPIKTGDTLFYVTVQSETLKAQRVIPLTIRAKKDDSILLESAKIENSHLNAAFDPYTETYAGTVSRQVFDYTFKAKDPASTLRVYLNGSDTPEAENTGELTWTSVFDMTREINTLKVEVSNGDLSGIYLYSLKGESSTYLSDFTWKSATSGDASANPVHKDLACNGGAIKILDSEGNLKTCEKGIGVHANSDVVIDLNQTDTAYTTFETMVGIDHNTSPGQPNSYPKIVFTVYGTDADGTERVLVQSDPMMYATSAQKLSAELDGIVSLRLHAESVIGNIYNAHADWADAKVLSSFEAETADLEIEVKGNGTIIRPEGTLYQNQMVTVTARPSSGAEFIWWENEDGKTLSTIETLSFKLGDPEFAGLKAVFTAAEVPPVVYDFALLDAAIEQAEKAVGEKGAFESHDMSDLQTALNAAKNVRQAPQSQSEIDQSAKACADTLLRIRRIPSDNALGKLK